MSRTFVDAIVPDGGRKYSLTANADGTTSIEDVTEYLQVGDRWGAAEANEIFATAESAQTTADTAVTYAAAAQTTAATAQATADGKVSKSGDTVAGHLAVLDTPNSLFDVISPVGTFIRLIGTENGTVGIAVYNAAGEWTHTLAEVTPNGVIEGSLMPKTGGTFTGTVYAKTTAESGSVLRNIRVADSTWTNVTTNYLFAVRK